MGFVGLPHHRAAYYSRLVRLATHRRVLAGSHVQRDGKEAVRMGDARVILHAEQPGRSFAWLVSAELAERLARDLRQKGWTVSIRPESVSPDGQEEWVQR